MLVHCFGRSLPEKIVVPARPTKNATAKRDALRIHGHHERVPAGLLLLLLLLSDARSRRMASKVDVKDFWRRKGDKRQEEERQNGHEKAGGGGS